jgi:hypothetical protein
VDEVAARDGLVQDALRPVDRHDRAVLLQFLRQRLVPPVDRIHQRLAAPAVLGVDARAELAEERDHLGIALGAGEI